MPRAATQYLDNAGVPHPTIEQATVADLTIVLGNAAFARKVYDERDAIEAIFREEDALSTQSEHRTPLSDRG